MLFEKVFQFLFKLSYRAGDYFRGIWLLMTIRLCGGTCEGVPRVGKGVIFKYPPHTGVRIGKNCDIGSYCNFDVPLQGQLIIGDNVKFTAGVTISAANSVEIGSDSLIAEWCSIRDSQHNYKGSEKIRLQGLDVSHIVIGKDVWIGRSAAVLMGSHVTDGCVVGANSIVKKQTLEPDSVYVGVPLKKIGMRNQCG